MMDGNLGKTVDLVKRLIEFKSCTRENANEALNYVADYLREHGLTPEVLENEGHLMLRCHVGHGERCLVLNGHLDVVAGKEEQYTPRITEDGRLYGRGAYDMLGACGVMIRQMCELKERDPDCQVNLTLSTTEETAGELCTGHMVEHGVTGDFAICGEPTNLAISVMSKGVFRVRLHVYGRAAHSSRPWQGDNALIKAYGIYQKICGLPFVGRKNRFFDGASVNLSMIQGGVVMNQVPDYAQMVVDIRYLPGEDTGEMLGAIEAIDPDMKVEVLTTVEAVALEEDNAFLLLLSKSVEEAAGQACVFIAQHGAADTAFFQKKGIPSVEFGPCGFGHHGPEEYVELASLKSFSECIGCMIERMGR